MGTKVCVNEVINIVILLHVSVTADDKKNTIIQPVKTLGAHSKDLAMIFIT